MYNYIDLVQGDEAPDISIIIGEKESDLPIDLSTTVVTMKFRKRGDVATTDIVGVYDNGGTDGLVRFPWPAGILAESGRFEGEVSVVYSNTKTQTIHEILDFNIRKQF